MKIKMFVIKKILNDIVVVYKTSDGQERLLYTATNREKHKAVEECYAFLSSFSDCLIECEVKVNYKKHY